MYMLEQTKRQFDIFVLHDILRLAWPRRSKHSGKNILFAFFPDLGPRKMAA